MFHQDDRSEAVEQGFRVGRGLLSFPFLLHCNTAMGQEEGVLKEGKGSGTVSLKARNYFEQGFN